MSSLRSKTHRQQEGAAASFQLQSSFLYPVLCRVFVQGLTQFKHTCTVSNKMPPAGHCCWIQPLTSNRITPLMESHWRPGCHHTPVSAITLFPIFSSWAHKGGRSTKTNVRVSTTVNQTLTRHTVYDRMQSQQQGHQRSIHTRSSAGVGEDALTDDCAIVAVF